MGTAVMLNVGAGLAQCGYAPIEHGFVVFGFIGFVVVVGGGGGVIVVLVCFFGFLRQGSTLYPR